MVDKNRSYHFKTLTMYPFQTRKKYKCVSIYFLHF